LTDFKAGSAYKKGTGAALVSGKSAKEAVFGKTRIGTEVALVYIP